MQHIFGLIFSWFYIHCQIHTWISSPLILSLVERTTLVSIIPYTWYLCLNIIHILKITWNRVQFYKDCKFPSYKSSWCSYRISFIIEKNNNLLIRYPHLCYQDLFTTAQLNISGNSDQGTSWSDCIGPMPSNPFCHDGSNRQHA